MQAAQDQNLNTAEDWKRFIQDSNNQTEKRAREAVMRDLEMQQVTQEPDFGLLADAMKSEVVKNPTLSPRDAYLLAKSKNPIAQRVRVTTPESPETDVEKDRAQVGGTHARKSDSKVTADEVFAKAEGGKFKVSRHELDEMFKGAKL